MEELNEQQLEAVNATERTILCLAAAGCGKTKTLISRVARLVKNGVDPTSILCLTFTNAAAFEMKERYKRFPGVDLTHGVPEFRTFHSFCYSLLIKDKAVRERIGYSKIPEVAEDSQIKEIKTKVKLALNCKLTDEQLETGKLLTASQKDERELFQKAFVKQLKKENVITFDMMCYNVGELFVRNEECVKKYKEKYTYLLIDEMQDCNKNQFRFVASFPETTNFFMVGDVLQCQPAGTKISMCDGSVKNIEDIEVGDKVLSYNIQTGCYDSDLKTGKRVVKIAKRMANNIIEIRTETHSSKYTKDHLTYYKPHVKNDDSCYEITGIEAGGIIPEEMDLVVVDSTLSNTYEQVIEIVECDSDWVYSLEVEDNHNYVADGILTHNCIYQFRGTSNEYIKQLTDDPNWRVIKMYKNYRSTRQICDFANRFSKYSKDDYRIEMEGQRDGDEPEVIYGSNCSYANPVDPDHLSILIKRLKENKNECAILCRTNKECGTIRRALTDEGIQFSSRSKSSDALDYLDSALSNEYMLEWLSTKLDAKNYGDYIRLSAISENPNIRWFLNMYGNDDKVRKPAEKIIEIRNITSSTDKTPAEKFEAVTKLLRSKTKCKFEGNESTSNKEIIEMIKSQIKEIEECPVYCGTIHSVKGLEYDTVYVMGVNDGMFRLGTEEMNNLAYVAFTRARDHLIVFKR